MLKGYMKVPVVMQMEALECGAASLAMVLSYHKKWLPLEQVRKDCGVSRDGSSAKNVLLAARSYVLEANGYRLEPEELRTQVEFPCIIHWNFNHFVGLDGFKRNRAVLNDPARGVVEETIKASGAENGYFERWAGYQASVNTQNVNFARLNQYLGSVPGLVSQLTSLAILMLGAFLIMRGGFTVGMLLAFQGFLIRVSASFLYMTRSVHEGL